ncbi:MAG: formate acetyltransferase, partial [Anaerolineae bacterium]|nr:formate acetyltransferase [Anaerolineae bacterium]
LHPGIGATQHFCQDLQIGLEQGWGRILDRVRAGREANAPRAGDFYDGLESVVLGLQDWIQRTADEAREMASTEIHPQLRDNLLELAEMNDWIVSEAPRTFREACQWMLWFQITARMYNGSGSMGRLDVVLTPFYERDMETGILTDEEAILHIASLLVRDTAYLQLGGPDASGKDVTNEVSYLVLEAAHQLRIPANVGVAVGDSVDPGLLRRGVEVMFEDKTGVPKFLGVDQTAKDFVKNGYDIGLGYDRAYSGCHWSAIPGREYTLNDCVKINFAAVFEVAWKEMVAQAAADEVEPSVARLWDRFVYHLRQGVRGIAGSLDFHMKHMQNVFPELVMDLLCYGPIEKGVDASGGVLEFNNLCLDGAALATVADSFSALEERVEQQARLTWDEIIRHVEADWDGVEGARARQMMHNRERYGYGGTLGDDYAQRIAQEFTDAVKRSPTPDGYTMIPGLFSWANTIPMGKSVGATPNGRHAGDAISHGANPDPGFRKDGAPTAMAVAIASVQPGFGNTAPMQMELDPGLSQDEGGVENVANLIKTHFDLGGTQVNLNIMDAEKVLEAHEDPSKYPDLVVRVTGFSAYFASLS